MAKRYIRTLTVDRLNDDHDLTEEKARTLASIVKDRANGALTHGRGWKKSISENEDNETLAIDLLNETFEGEIRVVMESDFTQDAGEMRRQLTLRVSAKCANRKRRNARELQMGMEQKSGAVMGAIFGVIVPLLLSLTEFMFTQVVHIVVPLIGSAIGYGVGYAIGHMTGGAVGEVVCKSVAKNERHEERSFENAMQDWEAFLDELITVVDEFAAEIETTPSSATIT